MNDASQSKINWTALFTQVFTIAFIAGLIPKQYQTEVLAIVGILTPALIQVFRTWYTAPRSEVAEYQRLRKKYEGI